MSTRGMTHGARLVMMYLMQTHGMTPLESYLFVQHKRPTLNTHLLDILTMTLPDQLLPVNNRPIEPSGECVLLCTPVLVTFAPVFVGVL